MKLPLLLFMVLWIAIAVVNVVFPRSVWRLRSWQFKDPSAQPSEQWVLLQRITSVIIGVAGIVIMAPRVVR
ncbi:MAG: DUF6199 family natural product biosynthesis protein [Candidatus Dormibacter sp.]|uniref:DUF6199 family natural product biosynthesis protein n=1 Tax=Candidatus Dormibacter sp. TaxID=2973982 RepID=UPI000DB577E8|nr:MAG: hypothetical protein DLM66_05255 [Candidatus Dormibacteraeota bacterium]